MSDDKITNLADKRQKKAGYPKNSQGFILPGAEQVVTDLYTQQGDLAAFLLQYAGDSIIEQRRLLFEILYLLKGSPEQEKQWNMLLDIFTRQQAQIAEAVLLKAMDVEMAVQKPDKILAVLERLAPEKWAKRSVNATKKKQNPYKDLMDDE